jgi:hypothetical protein
MKYKKIQKIVLFNRMQMLYNNIKINRLQTKHLKTKTNLAMLNILS